MQKYQVEDLEEQVLSDEAKEVLGVAPGILIRYGISIVFITVVILIALSYLIRFPDKVTAEVLVISKKPRASIKAKKDGVIERLQVIDGESICEGQVLGVLESTAQYDDIVEFKDWFYTIRSQFIKDSVVPSTVSIRRTNWDLGGLSESFQDLYNNILQYHISERKNQIRFKEIAQIKQRILVQQQLDKVFFKKQQLEKEKFELLQKHYNANKVLTDKEILTSFDFDKAKETYIAAQLNMANLEETSVLNTLKKEELTHELVKLHQLIEEEILGSYKTLMSSIISVDKSIDIWNNENLLISTIDGIVEFDGYLSQKEQLLNTQTVFTVVPPKGTGFYISARLPEANSSEVSEGQTLFIDFAKYPSHEYGRLQGVVTQKSEIVNEDGYFIKIALTDENVSDYGYTLKLTSGMKGTATIYTDNKNLFQRLLSISQTILSE